MQFSGQHIIWLAMVTVVAGCSSGPDLGLVSGRVTSAEGRLPAGLELEFVPQAVDGRSSLARVGDDGRFTAMFTTTIAGVELGEVVVRLVENEASVISPRRKGGRPKRKFADANYESLARLTIAPGENDIDLELRPAGR